MSRPDIYFPPEPCPITELGCGLTGCQRNMADPYCLREVERLAAELVAAQDDEELGLWETSVHNLGFALSIPPNLLILAAFAASHDYRLRRFPGF